MSKKILILLFFLVSQLVYAQQKTIDSLTRIYRSATADTLKIQYAYRVAAVVKDLSVASRFIEEGLRLAQQIHNPYYISYGQLYRSVIYQSQGNYPLAIKNAFFCLKNAQETGNPYLILTAYDNIGGIYDDQKDQQKAIYYTQQSINWIRKINNKHKLASAYYYMSYYYDKLGQPRQALVYDQRANELAGQLNDETLKGQVYVGMGHTYLLLKQPEIGLPFIYKALALLKMRNLAVVTDAYTFLSDYYIAAGPRDSAIRYSEKQLEICKSIPYENGVMEAANKLAKQYDGYDQKKATYYYRTALELNQKLFDSEKTRAFENLVAADEQERREQAEKQREAEQERKEDLQLIAIAIFIPIFILLIFRLRRTRLHRRVIDFLGVLSLLLVFEFITLLIHPFIERLTGHRPVFELLILVGLASVLVPAHHELTHRLKARLAVPPIPKLKEQKG
ncbi:hypothetical protein G7092_01770 [Mucilaginibacter sp. HC2]|jgi:tetratricopeptide (TPR) repeat protein|uniref:hypothetical protein n=1 Tax=Mucilaginibacter inviolabilis TaxID=2714892 RepID=UPI001409C8B3|nr:hypothetical protein [Mucilaginibacter inviolabilis]NHA02501.1 hypothetical protein [Mucilaginibacter inviolabilis]